MNVCDICGIPLDANYFDNASIKPAPVNVGDEVELARYALHTQYYRFFTWKMARDDFSPNVPASIKWKRVTGILTVPASFGSAISDRDFLGNLEILDKMIYLGRWYINNLYIQPHGLIISRGQKWLRDWIARQEKNPFSIYYCHKP